MEEAAGESGKELPTCAFPMVGYDWPRCTGSKRMELARERCESNDIWIKKMAKKNNHESKFAVCINSDDPDLLTPRRIYQVLPDESAARSNYIRVIDNEGEDYLYPGDYFLFIELPRKIEQALLKAA
jgi:hypothetical protein